MLLAALIVLLTGCILCMAALMTAEFLFPTDAVSPEIGQADSGQVVIVEVKEYGHQIDLILSQSAGHQE